MANNYYDELSSKINSIYKNQVDNVGKMFNADKNIAAQQYQQARNQVSADSAKNLQALKEQMATQGLYKSGDNITGNLSINNQRSGELSRLNREEQNTYDKYAQSIAQERARIEAQQGNALVDAYRYAQDMNMRDTQFNYQKDRDKIGDDRWNTQWQNTINQQQWDKDKYNQQFNYQKNRDNVHDVQWNSQFNYQKNRDKINDNRWEQQWNYQVGRDEVSDSKWDTQFNYQKGRDNVSDGRWNTQWENTLNQQQWDKDKFNKQFDYQAGRDQVHDNQWNTQINWDKDKFNKQFDYQSGRDQVHDNQWNQQFNWDKDKFNQQMSWDKSKFSQQLAAAASRGSGGGGGYSLSSKKGNDMNGLAWDEFARKTQGGDYEWLEKNEDKLKSSGVNKTQINKMKDTLAEILTERNTQQRLKTHENDGIVYERRY